jgi:hypothetical protein
MLLKVSTSLNRKHLHGRLLPLVVSIVLSSAGCATTPYVGQGPHPQIERGHPFFPVDAIGNVLSLPSKLILFNWKVDNHAVSSDTEEALVKYMSYRAENLKDTKIRINQWSPHGELKRLWINKHVAWPYRLLIGLPITLVFEILLPGRLLGGDHYNPYTDTVHLYSDLAPVALHEAGHVYDFSKQEYRGTYALLRLVPFANLYQEFRATDEAIEYLITVEDRETELNSYKILYPAYGTYVGSYMLFPFGLGAVIFGHFHGRATADEREETYQRLDAMRSTESE